MCEIDWAPTALVFILALFHNTDQSATASFVFWQYRINRLPSWILIKLLWGWVWKNSQHCSCFKKHNFKKYSKDILLLFIVHKWVFLLCQQARDSISRTHWNAGTCNLSGCCLNEQPRCWSFSWDNGSPCWNTSGMVLSIPLSYYSCVILGSLLCLKWERDAAIFTFLILNHVLSLYFFILNMCM